jgi:uroporphyrinogen decarboxylase
VRRFGFDAAILFADILLVPHALGQRLRFVEGEGPRLEALPALTSLKPSRIRQSLTAVFDTVARVKAELPTGTALIGFAGAPWTVATYMIAGRGSDDSADARLFAYRHPEEFSALLDILTEATADYLLAQVEAGAEVVQLFESWAGTIPASAVDRFSLNPIRTVVHKLKARAPTVPVIVFPRGAGHNYTRYAAETGATAVSLDAHTSLTWARRAFPAATVLQGNLDPLALVAGDQALDNAVDAILDEAIGGPLIFNLGHGIRPETPIAHVERMLTHIRSRRV